MANIINGDNGSVSGTAGLKSSSDGTGILALQTNGTTAVTVDASQGVTFTQAANLPNTFGFKNRIINGAMVIDQRRAGASVTPTVDTYTLDRWTVSISAASKFSVQQSTTAPTGFINSLKITSASAYTVGAGDYFQLVQIIEGYNIADLGWGTASASTVTLSFQVYSSLTGTFGGSITNFAANRSYPFTYSISTANTWTSISVTIAGDTTGTWSTNNSGGIVLRIGLGVGSTYSGTAGAWAGATYFSATGATSVVGTNGATFYITGVQLEKGSTSTSFDYRSYQTELALAQRYYLRLKPSVSGSFLAVGLQRSTVSSGLVVSMPVSLRATPTSTQSGLVITDDASHGQSVTSIDVITNAGSNIVGLTVSHAATGVAYRPCLMRGDSGNYIDFSAEL